MKSYPRKGFSIVGSGSPPWKMVSCRGKSCPSVFPRLLGPILLTVFPFSQVVSRSVLRSLEPDTSKGGVAQTPGLIPTGILVDKVR